MPRRKVRTYYPAVTASVILVGSVGLLGATLRRYIPKPPLNSMASESDPFLLAASTQPIAWRTLNAESLAEARREGKPILLVIGDASSTEGELADDFGFVDSELADTIRRSFIPIRVDATAQPYIASAIDPIARLRDAWDPHYQIWYLTSEAKVMGALLSSNPATSTIQRGLGGSVAYYLDLSSRPNNPGTNTPVPGESQHQQASLLLSGGSSVMPRPSEHLQWLLSNRDASTGAWLANSRIPIQPSALDFLLLTARRDELAASLEPLATSGMVDWINGGFFSSARRLGWQSIDFSKSACINAGLAEVYAKAAITLHDGLYRRIASDTFDALSNRFDEGGFVRAYRFADFTGDNRSARSSFSPRYLMDHFSESERNQAASVFGLDPVVNPQMLPRVKSSDEFKANETLAGPLLQTMRERKKEVKEVYSTQKVASIDAYVVARLLSAARLLGNPAQTRIAKQFYLNLKVFRSGENDVLRRDDGLDIDAAYLGDYLSYADAAYEYFLLTGDQIEMRDGLAVLKRALEFFYAADGALVNASPETHRDLPPDLIVPEVADDELPSTTAQALKLVTRYAWALDSNPEDATLAAALRAFGRSSMNHFGEIANQTQRGFSAFFTASLLASSDRYIRISGKSAVQDASLIYQSFPTSTIIPILTKTPSKWELVVGDRVIPFPDAKSLVEALRENPAPSE